MLSEITSITYTYDLVKADNGLYYFTKVNEEDENTIDIYELFGDKIAEVQIDEDTQNIIGMLILQKKCVIEILGLELMVYFLQ